MTLLVLRILHSDFRQLQIGPSIFDITVNTNKTLKSAHSANPPNCHIDTLIDDDCWQNIDSSFLKWFTQIVEFTVGNVLKNLKMKKFPPLSELELSFLFTDDARIQILNRKFRSKNSPTNVLSFPDTELSEDTLSDAVRFQEPLTLGDVVFAEETINREAREQNKDLKSHLAHLTVHGILHLAGYDHIDDDDAGEMESLEIQILEELNIANPYLLSQMPKGAIPTKNE